MTYLLLDLGFLAVVAVVAVVATVLRRGPRWAVVGLTGVAVLVLTVVFDNVIVATGIVAYDPARILGLRMPVAPVEDLSYALAAVVLLPCVWTLLPRRRAGASRVDRETRRRP